ncbi:hypothetical protein [Paenibacillus sp. FSL L8-0494]|uniref:hypothetical protein n=1 Tax=Paenibacillus sp. FSL L8-0494 TaxID=2975352 RepID=UPI0030FCA696
MKKYFVGFLVGAIFTLSTSVFADDIKSIIGQTVQGTAVVSLDEKEIGSAVIINGTSYAPVRTVSEASGLSVDYSKGVVKMKTKAKQYSAEDIQKEIDKYTMLISSTEEGIERANTSIASGSLSEDELNYLTEGKEQREKLLVSYKNKLAELQAQLAELQK